MIKKRIFAMLMAVIMLMGIACKKEKSETDPAINIVLLFMAMAPPCSDSGANYYEITLDYTDGSNRFDMGKSFGEQTVVLNTDFERIFDWYIYMASAIVPYETMIARAIAIKEKIPLEYRQEIDGLFTVCTGGTSDKVLDGKLSENELYLLQTLPDVWVSASCSSVAVFGGSSETGSTIIGRNLEWFGGIPHNYLSSLQAVVTVKNTSGRDVCLIGYLGFLGCITGFNDQGLFDAIQVSSGNTSLYDATGRGSYNMNLRRVLDNCDDITAAKAYLMADTTEYAAGHLFVFADPTEARVFEYEPDTPQRDMRAYNSTLKSGVTWIDHDYTIGAVNSFVLPDFYDNHTGNNVSRWNTMRDQLQLKLDDSDTPDKVTVAEIKQVITYFQGRKPGAVDGDLYRNYIQQTIIFQPAVEQKNVEIHFHPLCVQSPGSYKDDTDGTFFKLITANFPEMAP